MMIMITIINDENVVILVKAPDVVQVLVGLRLEVLEGKNSRIWRIIRHFTTTLTLENPIFVFVLIAKAKNSASFRIAN